MTALVLAAVLMHQSSAAKEPGITLRLLAPEKPADGRRWPVEMSVVVEANRVGDVWVDRNGLSLEIRGLDGGPLGSKCIVDRVMDDPFGEPPRDEVRLRAGQTMKITLTARSTRAAICFHPHIHGRRKFAVIAVYNPPDGHAFPLRPRNGATPLTKSVQSNLVAIGPLDAR